MLQQQDRPEYYLFTVSGGRNERERGEGIVRALCEAKLWLAKPAIPNYARFRAGDRGVVYLASREGGGFVADVVLAGSLQEQNDGAAQLAQRLELDRYTLHLPLSAARLWEKPVLIRAVLARLEFIKNPRNYGPHVRRAASRIPAADYQRILAKAGFAEPV